MGLEQRVIKKDSKDMVKQDSKAPCTAFLFDAKYVPNRGIACLIKIMGGGGMDY